MIKSTYVRGVLAALFIGALAFQARAQREQWLEYHTSSEPRGYIWIELSTNPPPNVALPKLRQSAHFGQWKNAMDKGRWFVLDRAGKSGLLDRIVIDANGNGRLDDESPISANRREEYNAYFPPLKLVFKGEDGPTAYHLIVRCYQYNEDRIQVLAGSGGWYEGKVDLAGKKRRVQLFDSTVNGAFNDLGSKSSEFDRLVFPGDKEISRYLGRYLELDGQLIRLEVARDGAFLKAKKAEGVEFGQVRVPETISEFEAIGESGHFTRNPAKGEFTLPVGKYRVYRWTINRKDDKNVSWSLSADSGFNRMADFEVATAKPASLAIGEPIRPMLEAVETKSQVRFSLRMLGPMGESVDIMRGKDRPRAPQLRMAGADGLFRSTNTFEYG